MNRTSAGTTGPGYARRVPQESIQLRLISLMEFISSLFLSSAPALIGAWFGYLEWKITSGVISGISLPRRLYLFVLQFFLSSLSSDVGSRV